MRNMILSTFVSIAATALSTQALAQDIVPAQDPTAEDAAITFGAPEPVTIVTAEAEHGFSVEIARTPEQLQRGLMWRDSLAPDAGMLFVYEPVRATSMWMRNTQISLDLLYLAEDGEVLKMIAHAQPGSLRSLGSSFDVAAVLELAGGRALELEIRPGDVVRHGMFGNLDVPTEAISETDAAAEESPSDAPAEESPTD